MKKYTRLSNIMLLCALGSISRSSVGSCGSNVLIGGDFRYRHELIDAEGEEARNRHRIRARFHIDTAINDEITVGARLATGGDDPVSTNQTLDNGFSTKDIRLDRAFMTWQPTAVPDLAVRGGKMGSPFASPAKTELIWDSDLSPEGVSLRYSRDAGVAGLTVNAACLWVDERSSGDDGMIFGGQGIASVPADIAGITLGIGYYDYQGAQGQSTFYDTGESFGNSVDAGGAYLYDYDELEVFGELTPNGLGIDTSVFADYVVNIADDVDGKTAWLAGAALGKCKDQGDIGLRYCYRRAESDALVGAFTDSDFIGGGTDGKGHELNINYQAASKTTLCATYFYNKTAIDDGNDYHRVQFDVQMKF